MREEFYWLNSTNTPVTALCETRSSETFAGSATDQAGETIGALKVFRRTGNARRCRQSIRTYRIFRAPWLAAMTTAKKQYDK